MTKRQQGPELFPLAPGDTMIPVPNIKKPEYFTYMSLVGTATDTEEGNGKRGPSYLFCQLCEMKMAFTISSHRIAVNAETYEAETW